MQLVNSSYFGLPNQVMTVAEAVRYLGTELLKALSLATHLFSTVEFALPPGFSLEAWQEESILTARVARSLLHGQPLGELAYVPALLHDIGKVVLAAALPREHAEVEREVARGERPWRDVERAIFGVSHDQVGGYLLGIWGLPFQLVETVAFHHEPERVREGAREMLAAVHCADQFVDQLRAGGDGTELPVGLALPFLDSLDPKPDLAEWRRIAREEFARSAAGAAVS